MFLILTSGLSDFMLDFELNSVLREIQG